jgi:penicillin-binding protein 2
MVTDYLDRRVEPARRLSRFLVFALAAIIALSALTARLFYIQIVNGVEFSALAEQNRTATQAVPAPRGLIFDRKGRPLVTNTAMYSVKVRAADIPEDRRDEVVDRLAALLNQDVAEINTAIDANPGTRFDLVRVAENVNEATAGIIAESRSELPGVEVAIEAVREYPEGPLVSQILGYTGPISPEQYEDMRDDGYLRDDWIGKAGVEATYEKDLRGVYGLESVAQAASGRRGDVLQTIREAQPGNSLTLTIDIREQKLAEKALKWAMKKVGMTRGVFIVMNPQTGEVLALVSLPTYDNNDFARGISNADYAKLLKDKDKPLTNHAVQAHYPPGSTYKLVAGTGALAAKKITPSTLIRTAPFLTLGGTRHVLLPARRKTRCGRACQVRASVRVRKANRDRPPERSGGHRPLKQVEAGCARGTHVRRGGLPGGDRPGLRRRHADPADQRLRRPRERREALPAAGRPRNRRA